MKQISFLIKPASSLCDLRCRYCFYADVSDLREVKSTGIMKDDVMKKLIDEALRVIDEGSITFAFQGGEPTIAGLDYFKRFVAYVKANRRDRQEVHYAIQTNAMHLDETWMPFLKENQFLMGVSLDGYKENHDYFRIGQKGKPTYNQVMKQIENLKKYQIEFNVLTVLTHQLAQNPKRLYEFYQKEDIRYIQLIPCLAGLNEEENQFSLKPRDFARFYKAFFNYWFDEFKLNQYRSIGLFDNLIPMLKGVPPYQCGLLGFCTVQHVVESDGSIYPCDFYVLDEYCGGNIMNKSIDEIHQDEHMQNFLKEKKRETNLCQTCRFKGMCNGNCKRMNRLYFDDQYCAYQDFLNEHIDKMAWIAERI
ncbi:MAG: SPASM domain-containing protein [Erysipelotrichaceae bacterium]